MCILSFHCELNVISCIFGGTLVFQTPMRKDMKCGKYEIKRSFLYRRLPSYKR